MGTHSSMHGSMLTAQSLCSTAPAQQMAEPLCWPATCHTPGGLRTSALNQKKMSVWGLYISQPIFSMFVCLKWLLNRWDLFLYSSSWHLGVLYLNIWKLIRLCSFCCSNSSKCENFFFHMSKASFIGAAGISCGDMLYCFPTSCSLIS